MQVSGWVWGFVFTVAGASAQAQTFPASADASVEKSYPSVNYGSASVLKADGSPVSEVFLRFNVSGVQGTIKSAKIRLHVVNKSSDGPGIYGCGAFDELGLTYANRPARTTGKLASKASLALGWTTYDVTSVVKGNGTFHFVLAQGSSDGTDFSSRETANGPLLVIETDGGTTPFPSPSVAPTATPFPSPTVAPTATPSGGVSWTSVYDQEQTINGKVYKPHSAFLAHSIKKSQNGGIHRFEVRQDEARESDDDGKERSELSGGNYKYPTGTDTWVAYSFMVEPGAALSGTPNVLGQWHAGVGSPNFSFRVPYDNVLQVVLRVGDSEKYTQLVPYEKKDFVRGRWYSVVVHAKFSGKEDAVLEVWLDGHKVVDKANFVMGYPDSTSNYWKFGIYRSTGTWQTEAVQFANMELGTSSLLDRVTAPKPVAP